MLQSIGLRAGQAKEKYKRLTQSVVLEHSGLNINNNDNNIVQ